MNSKTTNCQSNVRKSQFVYSFSTIMILVANLLYQLIDSFGQKKRDYRHIKWFFNREAIDERRFWNRTKARFRFKDNQINVLFLKLIDSGLYSCQLKMRSNYTLEELAVNSTNFEIVVVPYLKGGIDLRSPKVAAKLAFLTCFIIFCRIIFTESKVHLNFN